MVDSLLPGPIDVHAHYLSDDVTVVPRGHGSLEVTERAGELHLGGTPMAITRGELSDPARIIAEMDAVGLATRVLSPPPYAFPLEADRDAQFDHASRVNAGLRRAVDWAPDRLVALGIVALHPQLSSQDVDRQVSALRGQGLLGVAVPPQWGAARIDQCPLLPVLEACDRHGLPVLVHPVQQVRPGLDGYYLNNLVGNGTETAAAIGALLLSGTLDALPNLRIAFVHGGGCAPGMLGRWDHAWERRQDVACGTTQPPSGLFRQRVFIDLLTHDPMTTALLLQKAGSDRVLLGSDRPFDMGIDDPARAARDVGVDLSVTTANARQFLHGCPIGA